MKKNLIKNFTVKTNKNQEFEDAEESKFKLPENVSEKQQTKLWSKR